MNNDEIKQLISSQLHDCDVLVSGDGSHFEAIIVGNIFTGKNTLARHKLVYATVKDKITRGDIHALNLKTYTRDEYQS